MICPHCHKPLTEAQIKSIWASYAASKPRPNSLGKKRPGIGGRPSQPTPCPHCGTKCAGAREARAHCRS